MPSKLPPGRRVVRPWRDRTTAELVSTPVDGADFLALRSAYMERRDSASRADLLVWLERYANFFACTVRKDRNERDDVRGLVVDHFVTRFDRIVGRYDPSYMKPFPYLYQAAKRVLIDDRDMREQETERRRIYEAFVRKHAVYPSPFHAFEATEAVVSLLRRCLRAERTFRFPQHRSLYRRIVRAWFRTGEEPEGPEDTRRVPSVIWFAALYLFRSTLAAVDFARFEPAYRTGGFRAV